MKAIALRIRLGLFVAVLLLANASFAQPTGRVVINEYMPRTSNTCGNASEFVELLNFGPGPVNIGCYILTTGVYSITVPPNTILQPGQFYVLAGEDFLPGTCGNVDGKGVKADLNWNACNCTNKPIPTASNTEGLMADDGYSPLVLLDPSLKVIDAVIRGLPGAATGPVTSSSANGGCGGKTFDIGTMGINYEVLGMAPGNQNSYARTLDGDCNWLKQPQQSGGTTNNRSGSTDISYELALVRPTSCDETGKGIVSIYVKYSNYASIFPMSYTLSQDINNDGIFDLTDQYTTAIDNTPPFIEIGDLPVGRFRVTVSSVNGCYLKSFEFTIIPCNPGTLPVKLVYFKNAGSGKNGPLLEWLLQDVQNLQSVVVEKASDGEHFVTDRIFVNTGDRGDKQYAASFDPGASYHFVRLKITQKDGRSFYAPVLNLAAGNASGSARVWPNPATDKLNIELENATGGKLLYNIYNTAGRVVANGTLPLNPAGKTSIVPLPAGLQPGVYHLQADGGSVSSQPISFRFVKH